MPWDVMNPVPEAIELFLLDEMDAEARFKRLHTTGPCGTLMTTHTASGAVPVCLTIQAAI